VKVIVGLEIIPFPEVAASEFLISPYILSCETGSRKCLFLFFERGSIALKKKTRFFSFFQTSLFSSFLINIF